LRDEESLCAPNRHTFCAHRAVRGHRATAALLLLALLAAVEHVFYEVGTVGLHSGRTRQWRVVPSSLSDEALFRPTRSSYEKLDDDMKGVVRVCGLLVWLLV